MPAVPAARPADLTNFERCLISQSLERTSPKLSLILLMLFFPDEIFCLAAEGRNMILQDHGHGTPDIRVLAVRHLDDDAVTGLESRILEIDFGLEAQLG